MPKPNDAVSFARLKGTVTDTGQDVTINAPRRRKRRKGWRDHVSMIDVEVMSRLDLTGGESRVLFCIMAHVPERGGAESFVTLQEIADEMQVSRAYVSQIVKALRDRHIVYSLRQGKYHVNTWLAYNGDFDSWATEVDKEVEPVWVRRVDATTGEVK